MVKKKRNRSHPIIFKESQLRWTTRVGMTGKPLTNVSRRLCVVTGQWGDFLFGRWAVSLGGLAIGELRFPIATTVAVSDEEKKAAEAERYTVDGVIEMDVYGNTYRKNF